jgi:hypothetical protein
MTVIAASMRCCSLWIRQATNSLAYALASLADHEGICELAVTTRTLGEAPDSVSADRATASTEKLGQASRLPRLVATRSSITGLEIMSVALWSCCS